MSTAIDNYRLFSLVVGFYWRIVPKGSHKLKPFLWLVQICHIPFFFLLFDRKRGCRRLNLTPILQKKKKRPKLFSIWASICLTKRLPFHQDLLDSIDVPPVKITAGALTGLLILGLTLERRMLWKIKSKYLKVPQH